MHEMAVAQSLIEIAADAARSAGLQRVTRLNCRIGVLRQVSDWLLSEAFELCRADTICAEATLRIEKVPMRADCPACRRQFAVDDTDWDCPSCGGQGVGLAGGDELELTTIEGEVEDIGVRRAGGAATVDAARARG